MSKRSKQKRAKAPLSIDGLQSGNRSRISIVTPEGVPLSFQLAEIGERIGALILDVIFMIIAILAMVSVHSIVVFITGNAMGISTVIITIASFLLFAFYFAFFEIRKSGQTPGKKILNIRVVDLSGKELSGRAVFARNLTRKVETTIPLAVLLSAKEIWPGYPGWAVLCSFTWLAVFLFMPVFNKNRQRLGDFLANTIVTKAPNRSLLQDITKSTSKKAANKFQFTPEELGLYGIYELQTLEKVLRNQNTPTKTLRQIHLTILKKMNRSQKISTSVKSHQFLQAFYLMLREDLEQRMLLGDRREFKKKGRLGGPKKITFD